jgi:putative ABC transport system permease protein
MIWRISWRNVWRNKLRSGIVVAAITTGLACTIFAIAFMNGMTDQAVRSTIENEVSDLQIHHPQFMQNEELQFSIKDAAEVQAAIGRMPEVKAVCSRMLVMSMASSASASAGVTINGIVPEQEKNVTHLWERVTAGSYFANDQRLPIIVGEKLAHKLDAKVNSKIVLTMQTSDAVLTGGAFRIAGIFKSDNSLFDESNVFVQRQDLARLVGLNSEQVHEIAVLLQNREQAPIFAKTLADQYPQLDVKSWRELRPEVGLLEGLMKQMMSMFLVIILLAMAFGIINTMLMAVMERVRELGMLMALGMSRLRVFRMIMLETIFLSLTGGVLGMIVGGVFVQFFGHFGINLAAIAEGMAAMGYSTQVYPQVALPFFVSVTVMVIVTAVLSSIYPARKALQLNPAQAIRME